MSDIFLSYAIEDRHKAARLAAIFLQQHWTVWSDMPAINPAADNEMARAKAFERAKVVITLRSRAWNGQLAIGASKPEGSFHIIVHLEKTWRPESSFFVETFDLSDWNNGATHPGLQALLRHLHTLIPRSQPLAAPPASLEELPRSELLENAMRALKENRVSRPEDDARFKGIFISYRRDEAAGYAGRLYDRLAARFGRERVFIDTVNISWGEDFVEAITAAAESCVVMIVLVSRGWWRDAGREDQMDDYVRLEVAKALGRKIRVIPILIQGASMLAAKELPEDLSPLVRRNALALSDTRWERDVEDLIKTLESLIKSS